MYAALAHSADKNLPKHFNFPPRRMLALHFFASLSQQTPLNPLELFFVYTPIPGIFGLSAKPQLRFPIVQCVVENMVYALAFLRPHDFPVHRNDGPFTRCVIRASSIK